MIKRILILFILILAMTFSLNYVVFSDDEEVAQNGDHNIYINYHLNGGHIVGVDDSSLIDSVYQDVVWSPNILYYDFVIPYKTDVYFQYWYDNENFEGRPIFSLPENTETIDLYAKYYVINENPIRNLVYINSDIVNCSQMSLNTMYLKDTDSSGIGGVYIKNDTASVFEMIVDRKEVKLQPNEQFHVVPYNSVFVNTQKDNTFYLYSIPCYEMGPDVISDLRAYSGFEAAYRRNEDVTINLNGHIYSLDQNHCFLLPDHNFFYDYKDEVYYFNERNDMSNFTMCDYENTIIASNYDGDYSSNSLVYSNDYVDLYYDSSIFLHKLVLKKDLDLHSGTNYRTLCGIRCNTDLIITSDKKCTIKIDRSLSNPELPQPYAAIISNRSVVLDGSNGLKIELADKSATKVNSTRLLETHMYTKVSSMDIKYNSCGILFNSRTYGTDVNDSTIIDEFTRSNFPPNISAIFYVSNDYPDCSGLNISNSHIEMYKDKEIDWPETLDMPFSSYIAYSLNNHIINSDISFDGYSAKKNNVFFVQPNNNADSNFIAEKSNFKFRNASNGINHTNISLTDCNLDLECFDSCIYSPSGDISIKYTNDNRSALLSVKNEVDNDNVFAPIYSGLGEEHVKIEYPSSMTFEKIDDSDDVFLKYNIKKIVEEPKEHNDSHKTHSYRIPLTGIY